VSEKAVDTSKSWVSIFENGPTLGRFVLGVAAIGAIAVGLSYILMLGIEYIFRSGVEVEFKEGTTTLKTESGSEKSILLLPVNQPWTDTGIVVDQKHKLTIRVNGSVNLAIHRLTESSEKGELLRYPWSGPDGISDSLNSCVDDFRKPMRLVPDMQLGKVIGYVQGFGALKPDEYTNHRPADIKAIGERQTIQGEGTLWLGVNDTWFAPEFKPFYLGTPECLRKANYRLQGKQMTQSELSRRFDTYIKDKHYAANYEDNIGEFLVQITKEKIKD
jgi:hypothetical protein